MTKRLGLYLSPGLSLGYFGFTSGDSSSSSSKGLAAQATLDLKLLLKNRWILLVRGVGVDVVSITDTSSSAAVAVYYKVLMGGGVAF